MNKLIARISARFLLVFGLLFGGAFLHNNFTSPVSAVDTPSTVVTDDDPVVNRPDEEGTTDSNNPNTSDDPANTDSSENPDDTENSESPEGSDEASTADDSHNACQEQTGSLSWLVCPGSGVIANAIDALYTAIGDMLEISPVSMDDSSPIYIVWQYARNITNIIFVIFLLIVIYSQLTGFGINNYGIKRVLPRLIIAVLLVNLSFIICSLAVDVSNIIGNSLRSFFATIQENVVASGEASEAISNFSMSSFLATVISGGAIAGVVISAVGGGGYLFFMLLIVLVSAVIAVATGLITISARQALVALLIMIAPLAFVAYLLPNTEKWFTRWKDLLFRMLIFYPMFSFLFGASQLVGYTIIISANSGFGIILGIAVQFFPLFFSWSLMKMSGTVLNSLNSGLRRIASPVQKGLAGWSLSKADQQRQHHLANSSMSGARLRRYLDKRRVLREVDTENSANIRKNRATEGAYKIASSSLGRDAEGNLIWEKRANRYTVNAKRAKLSETRATTAQSLYQNTLSNYGGSFGSHSDEDKRLANAHAYAFEEAMVQQFLTQNNAEADQSFLLKQYVSAVNNRDTDPLAYNRLIKSAAGALYHTGESSIMGQVIIGNAQIEERRRREGKIMSTKFGMEKHKRELRALEFDLEKINDEGFAIDAYGNPLEDDQYRPLDPKNPPKRYQRYIGVHKETGQDITKEAYDALPDDERDNYTRVKYFDITDDHGNPVQRVFDDDAGYMKELIIEDISIADPINRRYLSEIGVARSAEERDGVLRRYHSTIRSALDSTDFKSHAAGITPMLTSAANAGYIRSMTDYNFILAQSLGVASKPGAFHKNDRFFINEYIKLARAVTDDTVFNHLYEHDKIMGIVNNNGEEIDGLRLAYDDKGQPYWETVNALDLKNLPTEEAIQLKSNFIRYGQLPKTLTALAGFLGRKMSPEALASLKPGALPSMKELLGVLTDIGIQSAKEDTPFEQRFTVKGQNIWATPDGEDIYREAKRIKAEIDALINSNSNNRPAKQANISSNDEENYDDDYDNTPNGDNPSGGPSSTSGGISNHPSSSPSRNSLSNFRKQLNREAKARDLYQKRNDMNNIYSLITEYFDNAEYHHSLDMVCDDVISCFEEADVLRPYLNNCQSIVDQYRDMPHPDHDNFIQQITDPYEAYGREQIAKLRSEIMTLLNSIAANLT